MCLCRRTRGSVRARSAEVGLKYMNVQMLSPWEDVPVVLESPYLCARYRAPVQDSPATVHDREHYSSFREEDAWGLYAYRPERWAAGVPVQAEQHWNTDIQVLLLCELTGRQQDDATNQIRGEQIHLLAILWSGREVSEEQVRYLCEKYDLVDARV